MKLIILSLSFLLASVAYSHSEECCESKKQEPKVIYKTKWKTKIVEKPVEKKIYIPIEKKQKCCRRTNKTTHQSKTGNQKVIIKMPKQREKVIIKYRTKVKRKKVRVEVSKPNRLQLLIGQSNTKQVVKQENCCDIKSTLEHESDLGVQYIRDFGHVTGSIGGTANGNYYFGLGINW